MISRIERRVQYIGEKIIGLHTMLFKVMLF